MSAAVADDQVIEEPLVTAPPAAKVYMANREELELVKRRDRQKYDSNGDRIDDELGQRVQFRDGVLRISLEDETFTGKRGVEIPTEELIAWLERHPLLGDKQDGFWLVPEPTPTPTEGELQNVVVLAEESDLQGLEDFIAQEHAGWGREDLLRVAEGARDRVAARLAAAGGE